jgi:hypothetical protein
VLAIPSCPTTRYKVFFYWNSGSFMLSMALIIILVNPNVYRPAIRSNALSCCTAAGLIDIVHAASEEVHPCLRAGDCHPRLRSLSRRTVPGETTPE